MHSLKICEELRQETVVVLTLSDNEGMYGIGGWAFKDVCL